MTGDQNSQFKLLGLLSFAGAFSGLLSSCANLGGQLLEMVMPGIVFGVLVSFCFAASGIANSLSRLIRVVLLTTVAYIVAILAAGAIQLFLPGEQWSMAHHVTISLPALFVGGMLGAFLLLGGVPLLIVPEIRSREFELRALGWSLLGGLLGVVGWLLGPTLGVALWLGAHRLSLTAPTETFSNAAYGDTTHQYSLYLVWQIGIATLLGVILRSYEAKLSQKDAKLS